MNRFYRLGILATLHSIPGTPRPANRIHAGQSAMFRLKSYRNRQTMKSYQEYQKSTASLRQELDKIRREHAERVLQELRECIIEFGFRPEQLMPAPCTARQAPGEVLQSSQRRHLDRPGPPARLDSRQGFFPVPAARQRGRRDSVRCRRAGAARTIAAAPVGRRDLPAPTRKPARQGLRFSIEPPHAVFQVFHARGCRSGPGQPHRESFNQPRAVVIAVDTIRATTNRHDHGSAVPSK
ncbi:hypothetical protein [Burkholderia gladioli]|uniref:hypothetical protein n=1 Tax=Burkholderia gladioli TaxID=28095 RepID=UPI003C7CB837